MLAKRFNNCDSAVVAVEDCWLEMMSPTFSVIWLGNMRRCYTIRQIASCVKYYYIPRMKIFYAACKCNLLPWQPQLRTVDRKSFPFSSLIEIIFEFNLENDEYDVENREIGNELSSSEENKTSNRLEINFMNCDASLTQSRTSSVNQC